MWRIEVYYIHTRLLSPSIEELIFLCIVGTIQIYKFQHCRNYDLSCKCVTLLTPEEYLYRKIKFLHFGSSGYIKEDCYKDILEYSVLCTDIVLIESKRNFIIKTSSGHTISKI